MATGTNLINPSISTTTTGTGLNPQPVQPGQGPQVAKVPQGPSQAQVQSFNQRFATAAGPKSLLLRTGNASEIEVCGIKGTPNHQCDLIIEHEPSLDLLHAALS